VLDQPDGRFNPMTALVPDSPTQFTVDGGTLTPLAHASAPAGAAPSGIVVT